MNNAAVNIYAVVFVGTYVFISLGYIPSSGIAGAYGNFMFNILKDFQTVSKVIAPFYTATRNV